MNTPLRIFGASIEQKQVGKLSVIEIYIELYDVQIRYLFGGSTKDFVQYLRDTNKNKIPTLWSWSERQYVKDIHSTDGYQCHSNFNADRKQEEIFYVWIGEGSDLLYHEHYHLIGDIKFTRGVGYAKDSEEEYAYLGQWLWRQVRHMDHQETKTNTNDNGKQERESGNEHRENENA